MASGRQAPNKAATYYATPKGVYLNEVDVWVVPYQLLQLRVHGLAAWAVSGEKVDAGRLLCERLRSQQEFYSIGVVHVLDVV
jgi:hypothetical protein